LKELYICSDAGNITWCSLNEYWIDNKILVGRLPEGQNPSKLAAYGNCHHSKIQITDRQTDRQETESDNNEREN